MTTVQLTVVVSIIGALASIAGIYFLARSNARENARQQQLRVDEAIRVATAPLQLQLANANQMVERRDRQIEAKDRRIEALEDELRRAR